MKKWLAVFLLAVLAGCGNVEVSRYADKNPKLELPQYFSGVMDAWGIVQKRSGEVSRRFHVTVTPSWTDANNGTLDERFVYDDGELQHRVWTLKRQADGSWRGTAGDVIGEAVGHTAGNALHWTYVLRIPVDDTTYDINFDDWMWQMDDQTMMNRSVLTKFGFHVGDVTVFFRKRDAQKDPS
jgi:hypothetical protein